MNRTSFILVSAVTLPLVGLLLARLPSHVNPTTDPINYIGPRLRAPFVSTVGNTGSMRPTLVGGEPFRCEPVAIGNLRVGDIVVVYWPAAQLNAIHRVHALIRDASGIVAIQTKGDGNLDPDVHLTTQENLVGVVTLLTHPNATK